MKKKEFEEEFKEFFGGDKTENIIGYEQDIIRFLDQLSLNFDIFDLNEGSDYWFEVRTGIDYKGKYYSIVFNHDFKFLLNEYSVDELWELTKELEAEAQETQAIFNKLSNNNDYKM
jgi:proline racemase